MKEIPIISGLFGIKLGGFFFFSFGFAGNIVGGITCASAAFKRFLSHVQMKFRASEERDYYGRIKCAAQSANTGMNSEKLLGDCEGTNYHSYI